MVEKFCFFRHPAPARKWRFEPEPEPLAETQTAQKDRMGLFGNNSTETEQRALDKTWLQMEQIKPENTRSDKSRAADSANFSKTGTAILNYDAASNILKWAE
jgi:hypothetical protein